MLLLLCIRIPRRQKIELQKRKFFVCKSGNFCLKAKHSGIPTRSPPQEIRNPFFKGIHPPASLPYAFQPTSLSTWIVCLTCVHKQTTWLEEKLIFVGYKKATSPILCSVFAVLSLHFSTVTFSYSTRRWKRVRHGRQIGTARDEFLLPVTNTRFIRTSTHSGLLFGARSPPRTSWYPVRIAWDFSSGPFFRQPWPKKDLWFALSRTRFWHIILRDKKASALWGITIEVHVKYWKISMLWSYPSAVEVLSER